MIDDSEAMSESQEANAYVIEVNGQTAGIVARDGRGFRFHASSHRFNALEGRTFSTPRDAEKAAIALSGGPRRQLPLRGRLALALH